MNKANIDRVLAVVKQRSGEFLGAVKDTALDFSWDVRDAAQAGFGVPSLISSVASLSVAVVAAAGTAAIALDGAGKVFGKRECNGCNGWEGLRCTMCEGKGRVQYLVDDLGSLQGGNESIESIAAAIASGKAKVGFVPASVNRGGLPLPSRECPSCEGTGVMTCTKCKGKSWKPKINFDDITDAPWRAWDVYKKTTPPTEAHERMMADPELAAWTLFERPALESGVEYDDDVKQKMWWKYKEERRYDEVREKVERREPGWEVLQEALAEINPERARKDPIIVQNVPYYKAQIQIQAEVDQLQPPPRPANWGGGKRPLSLADWSQDHLNDPEKRKHVTTMLDVQEEMFGALLDAAWEKQWRQQQFEAISKAKIDSYLQTKEEEVRNPKPSPASVRKEGTGKAPSPTSSRDKRVAAQKGGSKKSAADDKKKRERQERAERLARHAAEREAAIANAKAARERRS